MQLNKITKYKQQSPNVIVFLVFFFFGLEVFLFENCSLVLGFLSLASLHLGSFSFISIELNSIFFEKYYKMEKILTQIVYMPP